MLKHDNLPRRGAPPDIWMAWGDPASDGRIDWVIYRRMVLIAAGFSYNAARMHQFCESFAELAA